MLSHHDPPVRWSLLHRQTKVHQRSELNTCGTLSLLVAAAQFVGEHPSALPQLLSPNDGLIAFFATSYLLSPSSNHITQAATSQLLSPSGNHIALAGTSKTAGKNLLALSSASLDHPRGYSSNHSGPGARHLLPVVSSLVIRRPLRLLWRPYTSWSTTRLLRQALGSRGTTRSLRYPPRSSTSRRRRCGHGRPLGLPRHYRCPWEQAAGSRDKELRYEVLMTCLSFFAPPGPPWAFGGLISCPASEGLIESK